MFHFMDDTWRERLAKAIEARGVSKRSLSLKAGMGPGYVHSLLSEGKEPTIEKLVRICAELDVPLAAIVYGDEASQFVQEVVELWRKAPPSLRQGILEILRSSKAP